MAVATLSKESGGSKISEASFGKGVLVQESVVVKGGRVLNFILGSMLPKVE